ncbi:GNAT family N-acetyltransferase [Cohnella lupini]|uniref:Ribosomal protein S18 acetylase RimI-like enzyme n=1 Tax=Cohnella lupini TaxID=1294267 RepID=A0A3D9HZE3_9BACL|nr:GNAT family N-acetyltransferase [Cohnella lupini]RED54853.1 ribosomal protein S18 acetylase RimI-like enzyme [Cohnella lupini]
MLKPTSIRIMNFILYFKIAFFVVGLFAFLNSKDLEPSVEENKNLIIMLSLVSILSMAFMIYLINKRRFLPTIIITFVVFVLSYLANPIQFFLSVILILLVILRPTRNYFRGIGVTREEPAAEVIETEAEATEGQSDEVRKEQVVPQAKTQPKLKKDPEVYIREATPEDSDTIYSLMMIAFEEYRTAIPPSSALEETDESIAQALKEQSEFAAILYEDDTATAMVRFKYDGDAIYFYRLSVVPNRRRRGYAKQLVKWIEKQGITKGMNISRCKVRQSVQNNLVLYQDMGYEIVNQELVVRPAGTVKALTMEKKLGV